jgi:hypothetical protein
MVLACWLPATAQAAPIPAGVYDVTLTSGTVDIGNGVLPAFPIESGTTFPVDIGTTPLSQPIGLTIPDAPINVAPITGTVSVATHGAGVTIDPTTGDGSVDATFDVTISVDGLGSCSFNSITVHLSTAPPGSAWDSATNAFTMVDNTFALPAPSAGCSGLLDVAITSLLGSTGIGNNVITLLGSAIRRPDVPLPATTTGTGTQPGTGTTGTGGGTTTQQLGTTPTTTTPNVKRCVVPKLVGKTLKKAKRALEKAGCKPGKTTSKKSKKKKGRVIKQRYKAGKKLPLGTKVALTVSKGPKKQARKHR